MASDAYMEISTGSVWGETHDVMFGEEKGRRMGAFEIASVSFSADANRKDESETAPGRQGAPGAAGGGTPQGSPRSGTTNPQLKESRVNNVTIRKPIDKASADLFIACCDQTEIEWGVISLREAGESNKPWLIIEFSKMFIDTFSWDIDPDASGDQPKTFETITFAFATIVIKYNPQDQLGIHSTPLPPKGWNNDKHEVWDGTPNQESETWY